jgi:hypothetical protein
MKTFIRTWAIVAVVALAGFGCEARAGLVLGELQSQSGQTYKAYATPTLRIAQSFSYGSDFTLTRLDINLFNTGTTNTGSYTVSLYSGGLSGTQSPLGSGNWDSLWNTGSANYITLSGLNSSLVANTTYWIGVTTNVVGQARRWSLFDNKFGNGTSYTPTATFDFNTSSWTESAGSSTNAMGLKIYGTVVVPEPSTYAMAFAGLACGAWQMVRRRRAR